MRDITFKFDLEKFKLAASVALIAIVWFVGSPFDDTHWPKWLTAMIACSIVAISLAPRFTVLLSTTVGYVILNGVNSAFNRSANDDLHLIKQLDIWHKSSAALFAFVALCLFATWFSNRFYARLIVATFLLATAHACVVFYQFATGAEFAFTHGLLPNTSMAPSMMAIVGPAAAVMGWTGVMKMLDRMAAARAANAKPEINFGDVVSIVMFVGSALCISTILIHRSSIAWAALIAHLSAYAGVWLYHTKILQPKAKAWFCVAAGFAVMTAVMAGGLIDPEWWHATKTTRAQLWPHIAQFPIDMDRWIFGMGLGTFRHWGPEIQMATQIEVGNWWLWAHNDWLQIFFELGAVGLVLCLVCFARGAYLLAKRRSIVPFGFLISTGVVMAGNYPLRLGEFAFLVALIFGMVARNVFDRDYSTGNSKRGCDCELCRNVEGRGQHEGAVGV